MPTLDVRLLGPLEVRIDGGEVVVPRGKTATILAILLDEANRVVHLDSLIRAVYGLDLPKDPVTQIQNAVGVLRTKLGEARDRIETVGRSYRLHIATAELDLLRCKKNEDRARDLRLEGRTEEAADALRAALAEWRGPALADQSGAAVEAIRRRYDEHRLALLERRLELDLELGRHADVVDELRHVAAAHGTRQRLTALLMRALHASGRTAEALEAYAALKERLADALGTDPDRELVDLNAAILRAEPAATPALVETPRLVPATLPRAITRFTGRDNEIRLLDDALEAAEGEAGLAVVTGMGGVGKTALAVRWAHRVAHRFPDGQLYFNLRGFDPLSDGADPAAVLAEALDAFGVPTQQLPPGLDQRVSLYRTVIARRRLLVVLDNARDAAQVRPLLPVAPGSFTLVTSRDRLSGLDAGDGADVVALNRMSEPDAWALLVRRIGRTRALAEEGPVKRIVAACGRLPLALTLIGAWAARHPDFSIASLANRLEQTTNVFNVLSAPDLASDPRSVFACSYQVLGTRAAQAFRLFGLHPGPEVTPAAMASLMGESVAEAEAALGELAEVHLAEQPREGRYAMHDLLRAYAKERFTEEVAPERRAAAADRMVAHYIHSARAADRLITFNGQATDLGGPGAGPADFGGPGDGVHPEPLTDPRAALAWLEAEYPVLLDLVVRPAAAADTAVWHLAWSLAEFMVMRALSADLHAAQSAALAAAERTGDVLGQVVAHGYLGAAAILAGDKEGAEHRLERAEALADASGRPWAKGFTEYGRAALVSKSGADEAALTHCRNAFEEFRRSGDRFWTCRALAGIGWHSAALGRFAEARRCFDDLADAVREAGTPLATGNAHLGLGFIDHCEGRHDAALAHYADAERIFGEAGNLPSAAYARELAGDTRMATGAAAAARSDWRAAEAVYSEFGCVLELARVRARLSDPGEVPAAAEDGLAVLTPGGGHERVEANEGPRSRHRRP